MPRVDVVIFCEADGTAPLLDWLDAIEPKARLKCLERVERLAELGHELRRPEADLLLDGIYELRVGLRGINDRMLYFFHGRIAAVLSQGLTKERAVPAKEIDGALKRKSQFESDPRRHTHREA